ncbi:MAG TPA: nucleoside triphosphate pyrophosphatase [Candidatus Dormibacteraeota bacterium]
MLRAAGVEFRVVPSTVEEPRYGGGSPAEYARAVALFKAENVAAQVGGGIVVGADTIVVLDGEVFGKPASGAEARAMLGRLSGRTHEVLTAVAAVDAAAGVSLVAHDSTRLTLRELSADDLDWYLATGEAMDKAGAYALQGEAVRFVTAVEGDRETVIGLPTRLVRRLLERLGQPVSGYHG